MNYDAFGETFGKSRISMRWEEVNVLLDMVIKEFGDNSVSEIPPASYLGTSLEMQYPLALRATPLERGTVADANAFVLVASAPFKGLSDQQGGLGYGASKDLHGHRKLKGRKKYKILDIGCGNGRLLHHILEHPRKADIQTIFQEYVGLDLSRVLLSQAKKDADISNVFPTQIFMLGDMRKLEEVLGKYGTFDTIFFIASFHHLTTFEERWNVLLQAKKMLAQHGLIAMTNWNLSHAENARYLSSKTREYPDGSADYSIKIGAHQRFYHAFSEEEFVELAEKAGLEIEQMDFGRMNSVMILKEK